jgi:hypothetical protein
MVCNIYLYMMIFKDKKIIIIITIFLVILMFFTGCNDRQSNDIISNSYLNYEIGLKNSFRVNASGGEFELFDDAIKINVLPRAINETVEITIESISNPVDDPSIIMFSCFEFGPNDTNFKFPIDLIISYDPHNLPPGVKETDIQIYVLNGDNWEVIEDSFANDIMNWAVAKISHFSMMGCAAVAPSNDEITDNDETDDDSNDENNSAQIWFQPTMEVGYNNFRGPGCGPNAKYSFTDHRTFATIYWDPVPYVQYYELKFEFNGNPPKETAPSCNFRDWGKYWCTTETPDHPKEGYIYHLGGSANFDGYIGTFDNSGVGKCAYLGDDGEMKEVIYYRFWPEGKHGFLFFSLKDQVRDAEKLADYEVTNLVNDMNAFTEAYVYGWDIWLRGVTETEG